MRSPVCYISPMRRLVSAMLLVLLLTVVFACGSDSGSDAGLDGTPADYPRIEGPTTNPIVDMPLSPDSTSAPDGGVAGG